jgi:hypothetical protein
MVLAIYCQLNHHNQWATAWLGDHAWKSVAPTSVPNVIDVVVHERQLYANTRYGMMYVFPELCLPRDHSFCGPPPERVRGSTGAQLPDGAPPEPVGHGVAGRPRVEVCGANQCPQCDRVVVHERQLYANTRYRMMYVFPELCLPRDHSFCGPPPERVRGSTGAQLHDGAPQNQWATTWLGDHAWKSVAPTSVPNVIDMVVHERQLYANTRYRMMYVFPELHLPRDHSFCGPPPKRVLERNFLVEPTPPPPPRRANAGGAALSRDGCGRRVRGAHVG